MQQLHNASEDRACAREILEALMAVLTHVREAAAREPRPKGGPSLIQIRAMGVVKKVPGARLSTVASHLALTLSATSRLVDGLVARKYVVRRVPAENRRVVALELTAAGKKIMEEKLRYAEGELAGQLKGMTKAERAAVCGAMRLVRERLAVGG